MLARFLRVLPASIPAFLSLPVDAQAAIWTPAASNAPSAVRPAPRWIYDAFEYDEARGQFLMFGGFRAPSPDLGDTWLFDGQVWSQPAITVAPSARHGAAMAYDPVRQVVVLFGGGDQSDTWTWNGSQWTQQSPVHVPIGRRTASLAANRQTGRLVLFGGVSGNTELNDTWEWDGQDWTQIVTPTSPSPREGMAMDFDRTSNRTVLFGGAYHGQPVSDTWQFDGTNWSPLATANLPPPHYQGRLCWTPSGMLLFSGHNGFGCVPSNDMWLLDNGNWRLIQQDGALSGPSQRDGVGMAWDPAVNRIFVTHGQIAPCWPAFTDDAWWLTLAPTAPANWTILNPATSPSARSAAAMAASPNNTLLLFGGNDGAQHQGDTWTFDGTTWTPRVSFPFNPAARSDAAICFDLARQRTVLFAGSDLLGAPLNDTWNWDGTQWTYGPVAGPSSRSGARMAFDAVRGVSLLFGGSNGTSKLNDLWSWNGVSWTQLNPATPPPARSDHGLAYDALRDRVVLFGGEGSAGALNDLWEWDGTDWAQAFTAMGPGPLSGHGFAWDPLAERSVLVGGTDGTVCNERAWSWDGQNWTALEPQGAQPNAPSARRDAGLALNAATNRLTVFGGSCGTSPFGDTWSVLLPVFSRTSAFGVGCVGSAGIPVLAAANNSLPILGTSFVLELGSLSTNPWNALAFGVIGFSDERWLGLPLPLSLGFVGMPGCQAFVSDDYNVALLHSGATASWPLPLPYLPALLGVEVFVQGVATDRVVNSFGAVVSNALVLRLGNL